VTYKSKIKKINNNLLSSQRDWKGSTGGGGAEVEVEATWSICAIVVRCDKIYKTAIWSVKSAVFIKTKQSSKKI
jgi:hypothetical protein